MRYAAWLVLILLTVLAGCRALQKAPSREEARLDAALSEPAPSVPAPQAAPEEPQKGFEQEAPRSQET